MTVCIMADIDESDDDLFRWLHAQHYYWELSTIACVTITT